jgi:hypothetical protein
LVLDDCTCLTPSGTPARITIGASAIYGFRKVLFDKTNSTISGTRAAQNVVTDAIDVNALTAGATSCTTLAASGAATFAGDVVIAGGLQVAGTVTTINSTITNVGQLAVSTAASTPALAVSQAGSSNIMEVTDSDNNLKMVVGNNAQIGFDTSNPACTIDCQNRTDAIIPCKGTTAQRPSTAVAGMMRFNTDTPGFEGYNGSTWGSLGGSFNPVLGTLQTYQTLWYDGSVFKAGIPIKPPTISTTAATGTITITSSYATSSPFYLNGSPQYYYVIATNPDFSPILQQTTQPVSSWTPTGLVSGATYYARAQQYCTFDNVVLGESAYSQTSSFTYIGDAIKGALSTSLAAYNGAANGKWVIITSSEYANLAGGAYVTSTSTYGVSDANMSTGSTSQNQINTGSSGYNGSSVGGIAAITGYVYALKIRPYNTGASESMIIYGSSGGTITATQMDTLDWTASTLVGTWDPNSTNYLVLKGGNTQFSNSTPIMTTYSGSSAQYSHILCGAQSAGSNYSLYQQYFSGAVVGRTLPNVSGYSPLVQMLYTPTKQWP